MYSQRGVGKTISDTLLGDDDHGFSDAESVGYSCRLMASVRVLLSSFCARAKSFPDKARCGNAKIPASLDGCKHCFRQVEKNIRLRTSRRK